MIARLTRSVGYLLGYQVTGPVLFTAVVAAVSIAGSLAILIVGVPLLIAASAVIRGCANAERFRLRPMLPGEVVTASYRTPDRPGLIAAAKTRWTDPATWRDLAYLAGLYIPLTVLGLVPVALWLSFLGGVLLPVWYHYPVQHYPHGLTVHGVQLGYFPNGPHESGAVGWYVQTLPQAFGAAAICLVLFVLTSFAVVGAARLHARIAAGLLGTPADPLAPAKARLTEPGPLHSNNRLSHNERG